MLKRNLIANYLGQGWTALMGLAFIPLYIKYLGIEAYGLIGLFGLLQVWLGLLDMGMTPMLGREMARFTGGSHSNQSIRDLLRSVEVIAIGIALIMATIVAIGSNWIATSWLNVGDLSTELVAQALVIMGIVTALRFVEGIYRSAIVGLQRQVLFNVVNSSMATLRGLGAVGILAWVSPTIEGFFLWQGVVSIITLAILAISTYGIVPRGEHIGQFSMVALRKVWRYAGGLLSISLLSLLLTQIDKILLSKLLSLTEFGYYTLAVTAAGALYVLIGPITQAFYPKFCELHARGEDPALADSYHKGAQLVSVVAGSAAIVLIFYAETFLRLWTQDAELAERTSVLLSVLMVGNLLNALVYIPYQAQLAHGWTGLGVSVNVLSIMFIVPAVLWAVPRYGALGAAWVTVALYAGYCTVAVQFMFMRIMVAEKWRWYRHDLLQPLIAATLGVGMIKLLWPLPETISSQIMVLAFSSLSALIVSSLVASHVRIQLKLGLNKVAQALSSYRIFRN